MRHVGVWVFCFVFCQRDHRGVSGWVFFFCVLQKGCASSYVLHNVCGVVYLFFRRQDLNEVWLN